MRTAPVLHHVLAATFFGSIAAAQQQQQQQHQQALLNINPSWSPDGRQLAFERAYDWPGSAQSAELVA